MLINQVDAGNPVIYARFVPTGYRKRRRMTFIRSCAIIINFALRFDVISTEKVIDLNRGN